MNSPKLVVYRPITRDICVVTSLRDNSSNLYVTSACIIAQFPQNQKRPSNRLHMNATVLRLRSETFSAKIKRLEEKAPKLSGYLRKRGEIFTTWKKRYMILDQGVLSWRHDNKPESQAIKSSAVVSVITWGGRNFGLCIRLENGRDLYVDCGTDTNQDLWYDAIENHVALNKLKSMGSETYEEEIQQKAEIESPTTVDHYEVLINRVEI